MISPFLGAWLLGALLAPLPAPPADVQAGDGTQVVSLAGPWRHRLGDDPKWSRVDFDDRDWEPVPVPSGWGRTEPKGRWPFAWYRVVVQVPPGSSGLGVTVGKVDSAYELFAGGRLIGRMGSLPPRAEAVYDRHATFNVLRESIGGDGRLLLALRVWKSEDTTPTWGAPVEGPFLLGPIEALTRRELQSELAELILCTLFLFTGLYHLVLYSRRRELREYLLFGVVAVATGIYSFLRTQWKYVLTDRFLALKEVEHALLFLLAALFIEVLGPLLGRRVPRALAGPIEVLNLAFALLSAGSPGLWLNLRLLAIWQYGALVVTVALLAAMVAALRRREPEARTLSAGIAVMIACYLNDLAVDRGFYLAPRLVPFGFAAFVVSMALSLANRFTRVYGEVWELRNKLEERVAERTAELSRRGRRAVPGEPHAAGAVARPRRGGQPGQERVPRQHEPRDPHADERRASA